MALQPDNLEREIEQQRMVVGQKLANLRTRLQTDVQEARSAARQQASRAGKGALRGFVAGAVILGVGVALAVGYSAWRQSRSRRRQRPSWEASDDIGAIYVLRCQRERIEGRR